MMRESRMISTHEEVNRMGDIMANDGHPAGMSTCYVVGIAGDCGQNCPAFKDGDCKNEDDVKRDHPEVDEEGEEIQMNNTLQNFAREELKTGLAKCTEAEQHMFKRMYAHGNTDMAIDYIVETVPEDKLDHAMEQVRRTLNKQPNPSANG